MKVDVVGMIGLGMALLLCMIFGFGLGNIYCEEKNNRYDVNLDGEVNEADYVAIKNYVMNKD